MQRIQIYDNKMKILLRRHRIFGSSEFQLRPIVVSLVNFELASVQIERAVYFVLLTSKIHRNTDIKPISKIFAVSSKVFYQGSLDSNQWRQSLTNFEGYCAGAIRRVEGLR